MLQVDLIFCFKNELPLKVIWIIGLPDEYDNKTKNHRYYG